MLTAEAEVMTDTFILKAVKFITEYGLEALLSLLTPTTLMATGTLSS